MFLWESAISNGYAEAMHVLRHDFSQSVLVCLVNDVFNLLYFRYMSETFDVFTWVKMATIKVLLLIAFLYIFNCDGYVIVNGSSEEGSLNDRPIIGVLSQEQSMYLHGKFPKENFTSYIAASYVKDVEKSGARVVPIMIGKNRSYYEDIMNKINGVLIPGGATYFNQSNGYADAGQHIYEIAIQMNQNGDYFPIFGTCLGFELLIILASGRGKQENRVRCYSYTNQPLDFTKDYRDSKMFKNAPEEVIELLAHEYVTVNAHQFCVVDENLKFHNLTKDWRVSSYSDDDYGAQFIASVEHKKYPFYGVQFHPEKSSFEWKLSKGYAHSMDAIKANRYFMDFFVAECRKNKHRFENAAEENTYLIYNYIPYFTGTLGSAYHQCYLFEPRGQVV